MKILKALPVILAVIPYFLAAYFNPGMPDMMASHWDAVGRVNGYSAKSWALLTLPIINTVLLGIYLVIPRIDPLSKNIQSFRPYFDGFIVSIMAFLLYIYLLTIYWNSGNEFNMITALVPAFAVLFYNMGVLLGKTKRNWFIGIRTPWTLSSDIVWDKTHQAGARIFKICALLTLSGLVIQQAAFWLVVGPIIAGSVFLAAYSYLQFRKVNK